MPINRKLMFAIHIKAILKYLEIEGAHFDEEIAKAAGISLARTRLHLSTLIEKGQIVAYHSTCFINGEKTEGRRYRLMKNQFADKSTIEAK